MNHQEEIVNLLRRGASPEEIREFLANIPEEELTDEPFECCIVQRRFIEAARQRAAFQVDAPGTCFPNPNDRQTHIDIIVSHEVAMAFCNVKDAQGSQLADTVEKLAQRCLDAEAGSRKQAQLIEDLRDEIHQLQHERGREEGGEN